MKKLLIFGGTTEGRRLSECVSDAGIFCEVHVATEYGEQVMPEKERILVKTGRMTTGQMREQMENGGFAAVVDATHPFATEVTENIREALEGLELPYFRLLRDTGAETGADAGIRYYNSTNECVQALEKTSGRIFLTTGSKELAAYCTPELKERLVVRVLPGLESVKLCYDQELLGSQIIAMQGPFSKECNVAQFRQVQAAHVVTKQTGRTGGLPEKIAAAAEAGATLHMICCPEAVGEHSVGLAECCRLLGTLLEKEISCDTETGIEVTLAGIGMGTAEEMTVAVREAVEEADVIFGAPRMLAVCPTGKTTYPYYLAKDILPALTEAYRSRRAKRAVVLFSGDTGFYSGAAKLKEKLEELAFTKVRILPGIASPICLAARLGISWQDAQLFSTHGVDPEKWVTEFIEAFLYGGKSFFLTSGKEDIAKMCGLAKELGGLSEGDQIAYGYQLGYPEEEVGELSIDSPPEKEGLYVVFLKRQQPKKKKLTPGISDDAFIRDKVPMTKEEIRSLVLCKMNLTKDSVVYDIGSGTGSVTVEVARMHPGIKVYAVEQKEEAVALLKENLSRFHLKNVVLRHAKAPEGLDEFPPADIAFLGGTGGNLREILDTLYKKNPKMQVLFTAVTMDSMVAMEEALRAYPEAEADVVQIQSSRVKTVGSYRMLNANNPVFLYTIQFR